MRLAELIADCTVRRVEGNATVEIDSVTQDSRAARPGAVYVAVRGTQVDGHRFIPQAIESGAHAIVCEELPEMPKQEVTFVVVDNSAEALGHIASALYGHPTAELVVVGVTGTNGKTTTATLLYNVASTLGSRSGLLSTIHNIIDRTAVPTTHTTPDAVTLQKTFRQIRDAGCTHVFMEVSSHAVHQHRIAGVRFSGGVFTNLSHDHLDYHGTFEEYFLAKKAFFDGLPSSAFAFTNIDDPYGPAIVADTQANVHNYALARDADFRGHIQSNTLEGVTLRIEDTLIESHLVGEFNAYNLSAAYGASRLMGFESADIARALATVHPISGRFDWVRAPDGRVGVVDFAHTPDGVVNLLQTARTVFPGRALTLVIGCGGDRDQEKRPVMGQIAAERADRVIFTTDNPRSESPEAIIAAMHSGVPEGLRSRVTVVEDRAEAIRAAVALAGSSGIVLVAGKGHEAVQEIGTEKRPFNDKEILAAILTSSCSDT